MGIFTGNFLRIKKGQAIISIKCFHKKFSFVILYKLAKFHYQTVLTSPVIQLNVFRISYLGIWWRHNIWTFGKLNFSYLDNKKSFQREIKNIFLVSQGLSFRHTKQNSKNIADTTFKSKWWKKKKTICRKMVNNSAKFVKI